MRATCADKELTHIPCTEVVPETTFAFLQCKTGYRRPKDFEERIYCRADGTWSNHVDRCVPDCGRITFGVPFISGGQVANISQVPWHVAVYELQTKDAFQQICGGTIISATAVISAAHCFWDPAHDEKKDAALFRVVAGKSLRDYNAPERGAQSMGVKEIDMPDTYQGISALYGSDIAVLRLSKSIVYQTYIVPICLKYLQQGAQVIQRFFLGVIAGVLTILSILLVRGDGHQGTGRRLGHNGERVSESGVEGDRLGCGGLLDVHEAVGSLLQAVRAGGQVLCHAGE